MSARWFVNSRGQFAQHDHGWYGLDGQSREIPQDILDRGYAGRKCSTLLNTERTGLLLYDDQRGNLVLLVTGLIPADKPADFQHRPIRATVLGLARLEDESACRGLVAIAVMALLDNLGTNIPIKYREATDAGFEVSDRQWVRYVEQSASSLERTGDSDIEPARVDPDTELSQLKVSGEVAESARSLALWWRQSKAIR